MCELGAEVKKVVLFGSGRSQKGDLEGVGMLVFWIIGSLLVKHSRRSNHSR